MRFKRIRMKIFLAMIVATALPLAITCGIILYQVSQNIEEDRMFAKNRVEEDLKSRIEEYGEALNETAYQIYSNASLIESIALDKEFLTDSRTYDTVRDIREFFFSVYYQSRLTDIMGMYLIRSDGEQMGAFYPGLHPHYKPEYAQSLLEMMERSGNKPFITFNYHTEYGEPVMQFLYPVRYMGNPVGLLVIDLREKGFRTLVERYNDFYHGRIVLTDSTERIIYDTAPEAVDSSFDSDSYDDKAVRLTVPLNDSTWTLRYFYENDPKLQFYSTAAYSMVGFVCLLAVLFSYALSFSLTKPIVHLHRKMGRIQIGDYDARVDVESQDEIGYLGKQFNQMAETIQQLIEHDLKLRLMNQESQIKALQAQISPHFLFNTLQLMSGIAEVNKVPDLKLICKSLSHMYRYNMKIENEWVTVRDELIHIRNYLVIINKRYSGLIRSRIVIEPSIRELYIPKLVLQPIVENAVEHGLIPSKGTKKLLRISGRVFKERDAIYLYVTDNGAGMTEEESVYVGDLLDRNNRIHQFHRDSIGLSNVNVRIGLICGENYGIVVRSRKNMGTYVIYKLPLKGAIPG
ncbi:histidine kinase [Paenibacillus sp. LHD-38]|uniref:cache domain-containing sensor histidine kinase n=1 Tax=Paenibacillus sp. LHD-38 TaxID=3072143 RepID=UPI00280E9096|nr:histidine kinase [Paenibacillus sp. LHD-38]MDQ8734574.1 histidine kinase [Paenibacillus sp. LHD-38]